MQPSFAVCLKSEGASLERHKLYALLPDARAARDGLVRVIDEDGEGYLYPAEWFVVLKLPRLVEESVLADG